MKLKSNEVVIITRHQVGGGRVFINGHEIASVMDIDTSALASPSEVRNIKLTIAVDEFKIVRDTSGEPDQK